MPSCLSVPESLLLNDPTDSEMSLPSEQNEAVGPSEIVPTFH